MLAEELAEYAHSLQYSDLDEKTILSMKKRFLDALACCYAGLEEPPVQNILQYASSKNGNPDAHVPCTDIQCEIQTAALATGTLVRYLDWNDTYLSKEPAHPSDNFGALIPVTHANNCSGRELILASTLAYELQCRLCDAASLRKHGFDHVNYGLVSATLGTGKLMELDKEQMVQAVDIALNNHITLRQDRSGTLTEWKGIAFSNVARNAIFAVELAKNGVQGPSPIFEGQFGFFNEISGPFSLDIEDFGGRDGEFKINQSYIKFYPVEYHAQAAVHLALQLAEEHDIDWQEIENIENETYEAAVSIIGGDDEKWDPQTRETADHSMPYCIARAFVDREMGLAQFAPDKIQDQQIRELMQKIRLEENQEYTRAYGTSFPHRMVVHTAGDTYEAQLDYPKGHPGNPLTVDEIEQKFRQNASQYLEEEKITGLLDRINNLEDENNLTDIIQMTVVE